ncbi:MAG: GTP-binding protein [Myxococcota bacterium]
MASHSASGPRASSVQDRGETDPLAVHLLSGLPSPGNEAAFAQMRESLRILELAEAPDPDLLRARDVGIRLPPHAEPGAIVDSWEDGVFLSELFGRPARLASVVTLIDAEAAIALLESTGSLAERGWGRNAFDVRTVADLAVEQIEAATHLWLSGRGPCREELIRRLELLNPAAVRVEMEAGAIAEVVRRASRGRPIRVVPAWLDLLRSDPSRAIAADRPGHLVYRRAWPFDPERLGDWFAAPPRGLVRGKGRIWLATHWDESFGYSCAGVVHRLFGAGGWWAARSDGGWPSCPVQQRDLLARWHPRFGDRRQELVLVGLDLDREAICASLDACLVDEVELESRPDASAWNDLRLPDGSGVH